MPSSHSKLIYPAWIGVAIAFYAFIAIGRGGWESTALDPGTYNPDPATVTLLFLSQVSGYIVARQAAC